ncbi:ribosomal subunit interface protein [Anaerococcus lactolyticus ATCC 51172]|uniref:Ribosome hibernation promoting factor n=1 Tax=Anaerococcus lactolyticus ATCC 51172 TaxID=525254 RepID=C2BHL1_9FIRM|nr:ribosome-associated translation inhibitor RaiA [Anaerococcus lactolyticus]EEI85624.1 ribosomal subunit interface protein [Anaerococcus lactolyticus ATCC 51172]
MKLNIKAKNFTLTEDIRIESEKKFDRLDKYFHDEEDMDLKFAKEGVGYELEATMFLKGGTILRAEAYEETFENAIDRVIDALVRQIRKHKTRLQRGRQTGDSIKFEAFDAEEKANEKEEEIKIAREKTIPVKPMSAEEAILQMELLNHNFFVYEDAEDMEVRVVYKRKKGDYGLIVPTK